MLRFMLAAITSRKFRSTARLKPTPATAGSAFSSRDKRSSSAASTTSRAPLTTSLSRITSWSAPAFM